MMWGRREVLKARWCEPTLSVVDVRIGDEDGSGDSAYRFGPTRFSVIPRSAVGNVSIRFVPDQNADHLIAALRCALCLALHVASLDAINDRMAAVVSGLCCHIAHLCHLFLARRTLRSRPQLQCTMLFSATPCYSLPPFSTQGAC